MYIGLHLTCIQHHRTEWSRRNFAEVFVMGKTRMMWLLCWKMYVDVLSHFDAIHERNRQTDGQTDGQKSYINISRQHCCVSSAVVAVNAVVTDPSPSSLVQVSPSHPSVELPCSLWQSVVRVCSNQSTSSCCCISVVARWVVSCVAFSSSCCRSMPSWSTSWSVPAVYAYVRRTTFASLRLLVTDSTTAPAVWTIALDELMPSFLAAMTPRWWTLKENQRSFFEAVECKGECLEQSPSHLSPR